MASVYGRKNMVRFGLLGVSGFVAQRHLEAIQSVGGELFAACDPFDSAGILDRYFPNAKFFKTEDHFYAGIAKGNLLEPINYVSLCTPNHLHVKQSISVLERGANVICEKPLAIELSDLSVLEKKEQQHARRVFTILQLRYHPEVIRLKQFVKENDLKHCVEVKYVTPRGQWYQQSWKGDPKLSGGVAFNIGIHLFDLLLWIFGAPQSVEVRNAGEGYLKGNLTLEKADVEWFLSIRRSDLPNPSSGAPHRSIICNSHSIDLSSGFAELHTQCYSEILQGRGFGIHDVRPSLELTALIERLSRDHIERVSMRSGPVS